MDWFAPLRLCTSLTFNWIFPLACELSVLFHCFVPFQGRVYHWKLMVGRMVHNVVYYINLEYYLPSTLCLIVTYRMRYRGRETYFTEIRISLLAWTSTEVPQRLFVCTHMISVVPPRQSTLYLLNECSKFEGSSCNLNDLGNILCDFSLNTHDLWQCYWEMFNNGLCGGSKYTCLKHLPISVV